MLAPVGPARVKATLYQPNGTLEVLDVSGTLLGSKGVVKYEDLPSGCGAATLVLGLLYEQVEALGYWAARQIVEISTADDLLQTSCSSGASKIYVGSTLAYDLAQGQDKGQLAFDDGSTVTMRVPVTGTGTDGGGPYVTIGAPLSGGGNPTTLPAYSAGTTIFRRRYSGSVIQRTRPNQKAPHVEIRCAGLQRRLAEAVCSFALTTSTVDVGSAIYEVLAQFASDWPELTIDPANFGATGWTTFDNTYDRVVVQRVVGDLLAAANSTGSRWTLRVGHDRTPRLVKLYDGGGNTYTYNVTVQQGVTAFEARNFVNVDQDASQLYNEIEVIGDVDPATQQPVAAIVTDSTSQGLYGIIAAQPTTNTACKTVAQCATYGQALLNQQAAPRANASFVLGTRNDSVTSGPMGLSRGDVVLGVQNVTVSNFESGASSVYGLTSSVVTTVDAGGDSYQEVRFSAIVPDWNEAIKERVNGLAAALLQNTSTGSSTDSYYVTSQAFANGIPSAGLIVTTPPFLAIFAAGTPPIACGGNSFTLAQGATNWVWLLSNGTWQVNQDSTRVSNAILFGIYTTSTPAYLTTEGGAWLTTEGGTPLIMESGSVVGFIQKAAVGLIELADFTGAAIDRTTGYIVISDQAVYPTGQQVQLNAAGVGSLISAMWSAKTGSASVSPSIWHFYSSAGGDNGYLMLWNASDGKVYIEKATAGTRSVLATSSGSYTRDATNFHKLEFVASETTAGTVNLDAIIDGQIACSYADSSSPYTSGYPAAQFRDATATNYIDPKTVLIDNSGSPSSAWMRGQGSIVPASIPMFSLNLSSPTSGLVGQRQLTFNLSGPSATLQFADGATVPFAPSPNPVLNDNACLDGTWYFSLGITLATLAPIYYLSQTAPTTAQLMQYVSDGVLPLAVNQSLTVPAGGSVTYTTLVGGGGAAIPKRFVF